MSQGKIVARTPAPTSISGVQQRVSYDQHKLVLDDLEARVSNSELTVAKTNERLTAVSTKYNGARALIVKFTSLTVKEVEDYVTLLIAAPDQYTNRQVGAQSSPRDNINKAVLARATNHFAEVHQAIRDSLLLMEGTRDEMRELADASERFTNLLRANRERLEAFDRSAMHAAKIFEEEIEEMTGKVPLPRLR
jgi:hypothetical protein